MFLSKSQQNPKKIHWVTYLILLRHPKLFDFGEPLNIPENSIVFSNEWLDAKPLQAIPFHPITKNWNEIGVTVKMKGEMDEFALPFIYKMKMTP